MKIGELLQDEHRPCHAAAPPWLRRSCAIAGHWELDQASTEFLEPTSKKAEPTDGLEPVYPQKCAPHAQPCIAPSSCPHKPPMSAGTALMSNGICPCPVITPGKDLPPAFTSLEYWLGLHWCPAGNVQRLLSSIDITCGHAGAH